MNKKEILAIMWLNTEFTLKENLKKEKPCIKLGWCPYGQLVEAFPLKDKSKFSCKLFGHDCPMFYHAEDVAENKKKEIYDKMMEGKE